MIAGLPWESWLLLGVAVGGGLTVELLFYRAQRKERARRNGGSAHGSRGGGDPSEEATPEGPTGAPDAGPEGRTP